MVARDGFMAGEFGMLLLSLVRYLAAWKRARDWEKIQEERSVALDQATRKNGCFITSSVRLGSRIVWEPDLSYPNVRHNEDPRS